MSTSEDEKADWCKGQTVDIVLWVLVGISAIIFVYVVIKMGLMISRWRARRRGLQYEHLMPGVGGHFEPSGPRYGVNYNETVYH